MCLHTAIQRIDEKYDTKLQEMKEGAKQLQNKIMENLTRLELEVKDVKLEMKDVKEKHDNLEMKQGIVAKDVEDLKRDLNQALKKASNEG